MPTPIKDNNSTETTAQKNTSKTATKDGNAVDANSHKGNKSSKRSVDNKGNSNGISTKKFLDLENEDEYQCVQSTENNRFVPNQDAQALMNKYAKFIVKEEHDDVARRTTHVFEFVNNAIRKKLRLTGTIFNYEGDHFYSFSYVIAED